MTSSVHPPAPAASAAGAGPAPEERRLDERQRAVLTTIAAGYTATAAGRRLGISDRTLRRIVTEACQRLGTDTPMHAVALAAAAGELDMDAVAERRVPVEVWQVRLPTGAEVVAARRARYAQLRAAGLSLAEAAAKLGVTPQTCRRYGVWSADVEGADAAGG